MRLPLSSHDRTVVQHPLFWLVLFARIAAAAYILVDPLWGFIATLVFDYVDALTWMHTLGMSRKLYYEIDKPMDWVSYIVMYAVAIQQGFSLLLTPFLIYRLIGQVIFMTSGRQKHFVFFPNFFEVVFFWHILGDRLGADVGSQPFLMLLAGLLVLKIIQEIGVYYVWPAHLRRHGYPWILRLLGQTKKVRWT